MSSHSSFSILFWIKKNKLKNGKAPLYARITLNRIPGQSRKAEDVDGNNSATFNDIKTLLDMDYTRATWVKYETTRKQLYRFALH
jgi:hypothetical protein